MSAPALLWLVRGAGFAVVPGNGHSTENDNPDALIAPVRSFIGPVEASAH